MRQCIELHWKTYCTEFILSSRKKKQGTLLELTDEAHVLYLCLYAAKHGWLRMIWLLDIVVFLQTKPIEISHVQALAKACHITPVVDDMLLLAEQWLGVRLCFTCSPVRPLYLILDEKRLRVSDFITYLIIHSGYMT
ncbi:MAG: nucleotidyltransferase family protein [Legionellaceae bacterium]|nr:nucleotidyltransferase family protein [Legionellaceae bacterium]